MFMALRSKERVGFIRPLMAVAVSLGLLACSGSESDDRCSSTWTSFQVSGDPEAGAEQSTWTQAVLIDIETELKNLELQAGFTDPEGEAHVSDTFKSKGEKPVAFLIGREALQGRLRAFAEEGSRICDQSLDISIDFTSRSDEDYQQAIKPSGWQVAQN
jgi:hypothetical protein